MSKKMKTIIITNLNIGYTDTLDNMFLASHLFNYDYIDDMLDTLGYYSEYPDMFTLYPNTSQRFIIKG